MNHDDDEKWKLTVVAILPTLEVVRFLCASATH
jgi:hypothetical protein